MNGQVKGKARKSEKENENKKNSNSENKKSESGEEDGMEIRKCDQPTLQQTSLHLTWVGARDACASKKHLKG